MSAIVCGKRSAFEESTVEVFHPTSRSAFDESIYVPLPPVTKRARWLQPSSASIGVGGRGGSLAEKVVLLRSMFGGVEEQVVHQVLEACNHDIDSAIQSLKGLRIIAADNAALTQAQPADPSAARAADQLSPASGQAQPLQETLPGQAASASALELTAAEALAAAAAAAAAGGGGGREGDGVPSSGAEWVELVVQEMMSAVDVADVRQKAATVLEQFEKEVRKRCEASAAAAAAGSGSVGASAGLPQAAQHQMAALVKENAILKRAVAIQHERQREHQAREEELVQLKQALAHYQEQLRKLEVSNYALSLHLQKAQGTGTIPNRFHPDVF
ncbi:hypothetical protein CLOM_g14338 [Closterium sp. NIES-68]|nr:hypothetical protein CLOM_g14338 [Closterium sp. NIES-68]GJP61676.1 hypothetical protein CLOP_g18825 [Closterium sp. NIES-67]